MGPTFIESIWIAVYAQVFARLKQEASYGGAQTDAAIATAAALQADAACSNLPGANLAALQAAIAALKP